MRRTRLRLVAKRWCVIVKVLGVSFRLRSRKNDSQNNARGYNSARLSERH